LAQKEIEESVAVLDLNNARLASGLGTALEVAQSEDLLAQSKLKLIEANKAIMKSTQRLNFLLNIPVDVNIIPKDLEINKVSLIDNMDPKMLFDVAIENRPDLQQVKESKRVILAQRGIARSKFFPTLNFTTYIAGQGPRIADLNDQKYIGYGVQVDFLKNLGMNYLSNYKKSGSLIKQANLSIDQKVREIESDIANSLVDSESFDREITIANIGLKASQDSFGFAKARLEAGVGTNIDLLNSQTRLTASRTNVLETIINYNKAQVSLLYSLGLISLEKITKKEPVSIILKKENKP
jgi:outer membrane protein TolC